MRILHVITSLHTGGAEHLMLELLPRLRQAGHDVTLCLFDGSRTPFLEEFEKTGIPVVSFSEGGNVYNPLNIVRLWRLMRQGWDIVHTHNTAPQLFAAIGSVLCSVALCTTEHTTSNRRRDWKWYAPVDRWMYSRYARVVCISDAAEQNLRTYLKRDFGEKITTIYNGVNVEAIANAEPAADLVAGKKRTTIVMVAGFRYQKDQDTLIRALSLLPKDQYELWLVGDGERRPQLSELAHSLGVSELVRFLGVRMDVPRVLKAADVVVMSSHFEGLSLSNIEGMSAGKVFIASDVDGLREATKEAGLLFPHGDAQALASIIERVMADRDLYATVADRCLERARAYDISEMANRYGDVYSAVDCESPRFL